MDSSGYTACLASVVSSAPSVLTRRKALIFLERHDEAMAVASANGAVKDPSWIMRRTAVDILARQSLVESLPIFKSLVTDQDPSVQAGAAEAIYRAGQAGSEGEMLRLLKDDTASVSARSAALSYIGKHVTDSAILRECAILVLRDIELSYMLPERIDVPTHTLISILSLPEREGMSELLDFALPLLAVRRAREAIPLLKSLLHDKLGNTDYRDAYEKNEILTTLDTIGWKPEKEDDEIRSKIAVFLRDEEIGMFRGIRYPM